MDIIELKMPRNAVKAIYEVLGNELAPESYAFAFDSLDLRDIEAAEYAYGLAVAYNLLRQQLGEDD
jgi:hypothetical protein